MTLADVGRFINKHFIFLSAMLFTLRILLNVEIGLLYDAFCMISFISMPYSAAIEKILFLLPLTVNFEFAHVWLIAIVVLLFKKRQVPVLTFMLMAFFCVLEMMAHFVYGMSSINRVLGYLTTLFITIYLVYDRHSGIDYYQCIKNYVLGLTLLFGLFYLNAFVLKGPSFLTDVLSGGTRFGGTAGDYFEGMKVSLNANTLAYFSICGMASVVVLTHQRRALGREALVLWGAFSVFIMGGAMTISRTWMLLMVLLIMAYLFSCGGDARKFVVRAVGITVAGLLVLWFFLEKTSLIDSFLKRFQTERIESAGGRTISTKAYLNAFFSSDRFMLIGTGVTDYHWVIRIGESVHNGLTQILVCCGVPGAILMLLTLYSPLYNAKAERVKSIYWIPVIFVFLFTQTIQFLNPVGLMLPHVVGVYALRLGAKK